MVRTEARRGAWIAAGILGIVIGAGTIALFSRGGAGHPGDWLIPIARADVGKGDYLFLPNRMAMWVVNRTNGKIVHYLFYDNQIGTVERSRIALVDLKTFPIRDTDYMLSDRNLTSFLWVVNRVTGDFQLWRANRDGTLSTDEFAVPAGDHLNGEASAPRLGVGTADAPARRPAQADGHAASPPVTPAAAPAGPPPGRSIRKAVNRRAVDPAPAGE